MRLTFLGAAGTVTGSKFLLETQGKRLLVDCGLFQGLKALRRRNREPLSVAPDSLDAVLLTHAHLDHSGFLPALVKRGFRGRVYCTPGTRALCNILLPDAGHLQEEEARYANERGYSKHTPALPLYTFADAERALSALRTVDDGAALDLGDGVSAAFTPVGHIVGAACIAVSDGRRRIAFSGDVGRPEGPLMRAPAPPPPADYLVLESTYGNRRHPRRDPMRHLAAVVARVAERGGVVLVPSFAVGRAQALMLLLAQARQQGLIPELPIFLNSPMATSATQVYERFASEHCVEPEAARAAFRAVRCVRTVDESKALNHRDGPMVIISASGMATGGRILHHLARFAPDERNAIVFAGFQAAGTRGEALVNGVDQVKIHGAYVPVRAEVERIDSLSAHADYHELLTWLEPLGRGPQRTFVVHGEPSAQDAMRRHLRDFLHWDAVVPDHGTSVDLS